MHIQFLTTHKDT